jgi:hypothetical protein
MMRTSKDPHRRGLRIWTLTALTAGLLLACLVISGVAFASGGNSGNAKICQKGGWASPNLQTGTGQPLAFASQDECTSYGATHGQLFNPSLIADPAHVIENQLSTLTASGFHPSSTGTLTVHVLGGADGSVTLPAVTTDTGGLPSGIGTVFTSGCLTGVYAAEITLVDGSGVHASTTVFLDCP